VTVTSERLAVGGVAPDVRDRVAAASGVPELPDKIWFQRTAAAVIEPGRCVGCGGCLAACPSRSIDIDADGRPTLVRMCTGCSACWDFCPLGGLRTERLNRLVGAARGAVDDPADGRGDGPAGRAADGAAGRPADGAADGRGDGPGDGAGDGPAGRPADHPRPGAHDAMGPLLGAYSARARGPIEGAQDGGAVTALLVALIERGDIDGAIVTRRRSAFEGDAVLALSADEIRSAAGSVYHQGHPLALLNRPVPDGVSRLAVVGTPCQLSVLRALQRYTWPYRRTAAEAVVLTVGLFCTRSFEPARLASALAAEGLDLGRVGRLDVSAGRLRVLARDGMELAVRPVGDLEAVALRGCAECADFAALAADIAVGNQGSLPGFTTVLLRTEAGVAAWEAARAALESGPPPDLAVLARAARRDAANAERHLHRGHDPDAPLWVTYSEHLAAYEGTDRAPVPPPPHRSQHYEQSC
jgi:coenzyme F420 hydrogenase subunit beta